MRPTSHGSLKFIQCHRFGRLKIGTCPWTTNFNRTSRTCSYLRALAIASLLPLPLFEDCCNGLTCVAQAQNTRTLAAVTFRASLEYMFADRLTGAGWILPEQLFKEVIREAAESKGSSKFAVNAFQLLRNIPDRKTKWKEAGETWNALVSSTLNDDALRRWTQEQFLESDFGWTQD